MLRLDVSLRKEIKISNVVCTADLKQPVNLDAFKNKKFLSANLRLYNCGYVKTDTMIGRVTVFASGKLISVGTKSPEQAEEELEIAVGILKKYRLIKSCKIEPKVRNIVSSTDLGNKVSQISLARRLPRSMYEPEQFPGLIYRIHDNVVSLIFASGKVIIVGAKSVEQLNNAYFEMKRVCTPFITKN